MRERDGSWGQDFCKASSKEVGGERKKERKKNHILVLQLLLAGVIVSRSSVFTNESRACAAWSNFILFSFLLSAGACKWHAARWNLFVSHARRWLRWSIANPDYTCCRQAWQMAAMELFWAYCLSFFLFDSLPHSNNNFTAPYPRSSEYFSGFGYKYFGLTVSMRSRNHSEITQWWSKYKPSWLGDMDMG